MSSKKSKDYESFSNNKEAINNAFNYIAKVRGEDFLTKLCSGKYKFSKKDFDKFEEDKKKIILSDKIMRILNLMPFDIELIKAKKKNEEDDINTKLFIENNKNKKTKNFFNYEREQEDELEYETVKTNYDKYLREKQKNDNENPINYEYAEEECSAIDDIDVKIDDNEIDDDFDNEHTKDAHGFIDNDTMPPCSDCSIREEEKENDKQTINADIANNSHTQQENHNKKKEDNGNNIDEELF